MRPSKAPPPLPSTPAPTTQTPVAVTTTVVEENKKDQEEDTKSKKKSSKKLSSSGSRSSTSSLKRTQSQSHSKSASLTSSTSSKSKKDKENGNSSDKKEQTKEEDKLTTTPSTETTTTIKSPSSSTNTKRRVDSITSLPLPTPPTQTTSTDNTPPTSGASTPTTSTTSTEGSSSEKQPISPRSNSSLGAGLPKRSVTSSNLSVNLPPLPVAASLASPTSTPPTTPKVPPKPPLPAVPGGGASPSNGRAVSITPSSLSESPPPVPPKAVKTRANSVNPPNTTEIKSPAAIGRSLPDLPKAGDDTNGNLSNSTTDNTTQQTEKPTTSPPLKPPPAEPTPPTAVPKNVAGSDSLPKSRSNSVLSTNLSALNGTTTPPPKAPPAEPIPPFEPNEENDKKRFYIVKELLTTERTFVSGLNDAIEKYYKPLLNAAQTDSNINVAEIKTIFSNLEHILPLNTNLLSKLEERVANWSPTQGIGDVLAMFTPFLKIYTTYSNQYDNALAALDKIGSQSWFKKIAERKHNVENLIITPIQRIPRYTLLLSDLVAKTPKGHPDYNDLEKSFQVSREVAEHVNKSINTYKNVARLTEAGLSHLLAPHRFLIKDGPVSISAPEEGGVKKRIVLSSKASSKTVKKMYHFLLFNDMLAWVDEQLDENLLPKKEGRTLTLGKKKKRKDYQCPLYLIWLKDIGLKQGFELIGPAKTLSCMFNSSDEKEDWWAWLAQGIRSSLAGQPHMDEGATIPDDVACTLEERFGKHVFMNGDVYEGRWESGKINGKGKFESTGTIFEGTFENTYKVGTGTIQYCTGASFVGSWKGGKPNGKGLMLYPGGDKYDGEFNNGKRHGKGTMLFHPTQNGDKYVGEWRNDLAFGQGTLNLVRGPLEYTGAFQDGKFHGQGSLKYQGGTYEGVFEKGLKFGKGVMQYRDGSKYDGEWKEDRRHGQGKYWGSDQSSYDGEWKRDDKEGKGLMKFPNGDEYDGHWSADRPNGSGIWTSSSGNIKRYEGDFSNGKKSGKGTAVFSNGDKYVGEFHDNLPHGNGKLTSTNGTVQEGRWQYGNQEGKLSIVTGKGKTYTIDLGADEGNFLAPPMIPFFELNASYSM